MATIPAAELAITRHDGGHDDIDVTYGALGAYLTTHAIGVEGPVRVDPEDAERWLADRDWLARVRRSLTSNR